MSDHSERLQRISDYAHHIERAGDERRLAAAASCLAARTAHLALAELHEVAARDRAEDWRPAPYQRETSGWTPLRLRPAPVLIDQI